MNERALRGIKLRFLIPENLLSPDASPSTMTRNIEGRGLLDIPAILAVTEKEAAVCFRLVEGRIDYAGFYGKDPIFHNWTRDLFLHYWEKGKRT